MIRPLAFVPLTACLVSGAIPGSPYRPSDFRVTDMRAVLYYERDATFSSFDAMADEGPETPASALWNTPAGEGSAGKPSSATLILVRVSGPVESPWNATLQVVANARSGQLGDRLISLKPFFGAPTAWIPVLLYGTGCERVSVTATIQGTPNGVTKALPFKCGE